MKSSVAAMLVAGAMASTHAQVIAPVEFDGQATMNTRQGSVSGCGIRFVGVHDFRQDAKGQHATVVDGSISIMAGGTALKAGQYRATTNAAGKYTSSPILSALQWLRAGDSAALDRSGGTAIPSEDPGFTMFTAGTKPGVSAVLEILAGSSLRVSFKGDSGRSAIYSGKVQLKDADRDEFLACIQTLLQDAKAPEK
jgi:hypothetical protein